MQRDIAGLRRGPGRPAAVLTATAMLAAGLAACGSQASAGRHPAAASATASGSDQEASSGKASHNPLAKSPMRILTTLDQARLCAVLSTAQATRILGSAPQAPLYGKEPGLGIYCRWPAKGAAGLSTNELYVGISSIIDWAGAQAVDKLLKARPVTVDGRPALSAGPLPAMQWAQVDVALGKAGDPVAEYRAPTMAKALAMAQAATPRIESFG
ncbi:MAG TPA: DUF3558 family protein [Streptosporangiaceae bacterium]|jgi:hypothetical protein